MYKELHKILDKREQKLKKSLKTAKKRSNSRYQTIGALNEIRVFKKALQYQTITDQPDKMTINLSGSVKKKVLALANSDLHSLSKRLLEL